MAAKLPNTPPVWIDPDEAPELTDADFDRGVWQIGDKVVSREEAQAAAREQMRRGRPPAENPKQSLTVRYDADIVAAFKASGAGWQTRMNDALREWLKTHSAA